MNLKHITAPPIELTLASGFKEYSILCFMKFEKALKKVYWYMFYKYLSK